MSSFFSTLRENVETIKDLGRPFGMYLGALAVCIGVFVPVVTPDKLWVAAALAGVLGAARSVDKFNEAKYNVTPPQKDAP